MNCDIEVWTGQTIYNFNACTPAGEEWLRSEVDFPDYGQMCEPRFAWDIIHGAVTEGMLRVAVDGREIESITPA